MVNRVLNIPFEYYDKALSLVGERNESAGFMIYKYGTDVSDLDVCYMKYRTGDSPEVTELLQREELSDFVNSRRDMYNFIDFHTHTFDTVREFGSYYNYNFSEQDRSTIQDNFRVNPEYIHLLFTPQKVLRAYKGELDINIVNLNNHPEHKDLVLGSYDTLSEFFRR